MPRVGTNKRWTVAAVLLAVLATVAAVVAVRWNQGEAKPVDVADVTSPTGTTLPAKQNVLRPPQGVYLFKGSGTDRIDRPPKEQAEGPSMPATVTHRADGCWTFRLDFSTNHWQEWVYCPKDGGLTEVGGKAFQRWDFGALVNTTTSTFTCKAPTIKAHQRPGNEWRQSCRGVSTGVSGVTRSAGPYQFVGPEIIAIGDEPVSAYRYRRDRTNTGNQAGTEHTDLWFAADTGMPLRSQHTIDTKSPTVIGTVHYTQDGTYQLTSMKPQR